MSSNAILTRSALAASLLAALALAAPAFAQQSMFDQMPDAPSEESAAEPAKPAAPSRMTMPDVATAAPAQPDAAPMFDKPAEGAPSPQTMPAQCQAMQKTLDERKTLIAKANAASTAKKKLTPAQACALFDKLAANGNSGLKWIKTNKEACGVPQSFEEGFNADHGKVAAIRTKVCNAAAQFSKMEAQAREGGQNGGLLGGPGLSGSFKLPQGAL